MSYGNISIEELIEEDEAIVSELIWDRIHVRVKWKMMWMLVKSKRFLLATVALPAIIMLYLNYVYVSLSSTIIAIVLVFLPSLVLVCFWKWVERMQAEYFHERSHLFRYWNEKHLGRHLWIAKDNHSVVGAVAIERHSPEVAELFRCFVVEKYAGRGLGRELVTHCVEHCRSEHYARVTLGTSTCQPDGIGLYLKCGFKIKKKVTQSLILDYSILTMELEL